MRVLIAENSKTMSSLIIHELSKHQDIETHWVCSMSELEAIIDEKGFDYFNLAVSGVYLSGSDTGSPIELLTEYQIPTIVFSGDYDEDNRNNYITMPGVVDYVVKESHSTLRYLCHIVYRFKTNKQYKVLVASSKRAVRLHVCNLMRKYSFQVMEAENGQDALGILKENRDIKIVITGQLSEPISGLDLTKKIRETYGKEELSVIALSPQDTQTLSARFIKFGANDFIRTPFQPEEFFCRITQNIDLIEKNRKLFDMATKDYLTGLFNRRYYFDNASGKMKRAYRDEKTIAVAMLDIDHFKSVNDTFGHDVGDEVLVGISQILSEHSQSSDLLARFGGEEFSIMLEGLDPKELEAHFEKLRAAIESRVFESLKDRKHVTCSFGVVFCQEKKAIDELLLAADSLLYHSKQTGRNKVVISPNNLLPETLSA